MNDITKSFPGVKALDGVTFDLNQGEIHALVGENGAGKSTLIKILAGVYSHGEYDGEILLDGANQRFNSVRDSEHTGIAVIYQEPTLFPDLSVTENIFMGRQPTRSFGRIDRAAMRSEAVELFSRLGVRIDPDRPLKERS